MPRKSSSPNPKRKRTTTNNDWEGIFQILRDQAASRPSPSLNLLTDHGASPWQILAATILSLRTKDEVTIAASQRLFALAPGPAETRSLPLDALENAIFPAGFYRTKAKNLADIAALLQEHGDQVPDTKEGLVALPGVGPKTANLVLNLAFGVEEICVDIHVHRIPNRLGWISTRTPEESEAALRQLWPRKHWIEANGLLVSFGQTICTPVSPRCSICPFHGHCLQKEVGPRR